MSKTAKGEKQPYLTKKEVHILLAILAVIAIAVLAISLTYSDGSLKTSGGKVSVSGENSIVVNAGSARSPKYYKVGEAGEASGYTMTAEPKDVDPENLTVYAYAPEDTAVFEKISVQGIDNTAEKAAGSKHNALAASEDAGTMTTGRVDLAYTLGETRSYKLDDGREVYWLTDTSVTAGCLQQIYAYVASGDYCIEVSASRTVDSEDAFTDDDAMLEVIRPVISALSYQTK